jgi:hypothetical protein
MEGFRCRFVDDVTKFLLAIAQHTFPTNSGLQRIYDDPEDDINFIFECQKEGISDDEIRARVKRGREFISKIQTELNDLSTQVWNTYEEFIRFGRRKLGVFLSFSD